GAVGGDVVADDEHRLRIGVVAVRHHGPALLVAQTGLTDHPPGGIGTLHGLALREVQQIHGLLRAGGGDGHALAQLVVGRVADDHAVVVDPRAGVLLLDRVRQTDLHTGPGDLGLDLARAAIAHHLVWHALALELVEHRGAAPHGALGHEAVAIDPTGPRVATSVDDPLADLVVLALAHLVHERSQARSVLVAHGLPSLEARTVLLVLPQLHVTVAGLCQVGDGTAGGPGDRLVGQVEQRGARRLHRRPLGPGRVVRADRQPRRTRVGLRADTGGPGELALQVLVPRVLRGTITELGLVVGHLLGQGLLHRAQAVGDTQPGVGQGAVLLGQDPIDTATDRLGLGDRDDLTALISGLLDCLVIDVLVEVPAQTVRLLHLCQPPVDARGYITMYRSYPDESSHDECRVERSSDLRRLPFEQESG